MLEVCINSRNNFDTYRYIEATPFPQMYVVLLPRVRRLASNLNKHSESTNHYI